MKQIVVILLAAFVSITWKIDNQNPEQPSISFSFDDGNPNDIINYKGEEWNAMILSQLEKHNIKAVWFVGAKKLNNDKGRQLLQKWDNAENIIANHTYNHRNYNDSSITCNDFIKEIEACDSLINGYKNYQKLFRYPYLKTGNTIAKRDSLRFYLKQNGYNQGWVTIDASDWYVNSRLIKRLKENPQANIKAFKEYYINHIFDRSQYYNNLSNEINHRQVKHTVLLHFNLTSALFLSDLIDKFKQKGWNIENYSEAIKDPIYKELLSAMPSEQSLIWLMAKQTGQYDNKLRYPGEDGEYEKDKMDKLGL
jgi:peptidoglycan/xylan/chitin deacetylase (PgdA/CDA1 family)